MKALRVLEAEGHITLPVPQCALKITGPRLLERPVAAPVAMPDTVGAVKGLAIALVASRQDRAIWSTLMDREHPREVATLAEAEQMIRNYTLRWRVEDIFRILTRGCRVERLRIQQADLLHRGITLYMVTAWWIMLMTLLGRASCDMTRR